MAAEKSSIETNMTPPPDGSVTLGPYEVQSIRHALLVGLESWGEVERLDDLYETAERIGAPLPEGLGPRRSAEGPEIVLEFAAALRYLERG